MLAPVMSSVPNRPALTFGAGHKPRVEVTPEGKLIVPTSITEAIRPSRRFQLSGGVSTTVNTLSGTRGVEPVTSFLELEADKTYKWGRKKNLVNPAYWGFRLVDFNEKTRVQTYYRPTYNELSPMPGGVPAVRFATRDDEEIVWTGGKGAFRPRHQSRHGYTEADPLMLHPLLESFGYEGLSVTPPKISTPKQALEFLRDALEQVAQ